MREDAATARLYDVLGLRYGEHLLVWTLRRQVAVGTACPVLRREFAATCGADSTEVLSMVRICLDVLIRGARHRLVIGHPGACHLTGDERQVLNLVSAAQDNDHPRRDALLCWLMRADLRQQATAAIEMLAAMFAAHNLLVTPAAVPVTAASPRRLMLAFARPTTDACGPVVSS